MPSAMRARRCCRATPAAARSRKHENVSAGARQPPSRGPGALPEREHSEELPGTSGSIAHHDGLRPSERRLPSLPTGYD
eukprot:1373844-Pyramimonas_sp.AAC.1